jgi:signal transduction histidine kinase
MTEEDQRLSFEPFQRARLARDTTIPGAGLGLYVVRRLVQAHGGTIDVASRVGEGTRFSVKLPMSETPLALHSA